MNRDNVALSYEDVNLLPCDEPCTIRSRKEVDLTTQFTKNYKLKTPIIASPMDTICDSKMAIAMYKLGGLGVIHRFMSIEEQVNHVLKVAEVVASDDYGYVISAAIGVTGDYVERAEELVNAGVNVLFLDTAHGNHINTKEAMHILTGRFKNHVDIIPGNVAHYEAARNLQDWGAAGIRVNIGGGSVCSTRTSTKIGVPTVSSLIDCARVDLPIIMDGGMKNAGDIALSLALGANTIMTGSLLSGTDECPGEFQNDFAGNLFKSYRGSASYESKMARGESGHVEGAATVVPYHGGVERIINNITDGVRSSMAYTNARTIKEFQQKARWIQVTPSGFREGQPHKLFS